MGTSFKGKIVVITGAASGIGQSIATQLAAEGAHLALIDLDALSLKGVAAVCRRDTEVITLDLDVADQAAVEAAASKVAAVFGGIDVLINNAGIAAYGSISDVTRDTMERVLNVNLWGVINGTLAFLPHLKRRPAANLVNVSSVYGIFGAPNEVAYCTSKFAVRGFTEAVRQDLRGTGVAVSLVLPGGVKTRIGTSVLRDAQMTDGEWLDLRRRFEDALQSTADEAAATIVEGIRRNRARILVGADARKADWLARLLPGSYDWIVAREMRRIFGTPETNNA